jgi:isocitrate/isopropylmalate dehydrogenase
MSREAFESEARKHGFILDRLDKSGVYVQLITEQAWSIWQAATDAALERAAEEVEKIDKENWFAWQCAFSKHAAEAIRALKDET